MRGALILPLLVALAVPAVPRTAAASPEIIELYSRSGCPHCADAHAFLDRLVADRPELQLRVHDVGADAGARGRLQALADAHGIDVPGVPTIVIGEQVIVGFSAGTGDAIVGLLDRGARRAAAGEVCAPAAVDCEPAPAPPEVDRDSVDLPLLGRVSARDLGLPLFTVVVGLLDGFNPCATWTLLFVLALLVNLKDRRRIAAVGGTFVLVSGLVYFAFMAAWLNLFMVLGASRVVAAVLGVVALAIGALNLKDSIRPGVGPSLSIPAAAKPGIYARTRAVIRAESLPAALAAVAVLAAMVNLVELLCTAGLPALYTAVLTARDLDAWQYYGYLALYNLAYIADDGLLLTIAVVTLGKRKLQERGGRLLKLLSATIMLVLGALLLLRPSWLGW